MELDVWQGVRFAICCMVEAVTWSCAMPRTQSQLCSLFALANPPLGHVGGAGVVPIQVNHSVDTYENSLFRMQKDKLHRRCYIDSAARSCATPLGSWCTQVKR